MSISTPMSFEYIINVLRQFKIGDKQGISKTCATLRRTMIEMGKDLKDAGELIDTACRQLRWEQSKKRELK